MVDVWGVLEYVWLAGLDVFSRAAVDGLNGFAVGEK